MTSARDSDPDDVDALLKGIDGLLADAVAKEEARPPGPEPQPPAPPPPGSPSTRLARARALLARTLAPKRDDLAIPTVERIRVAVTEPVRSWPAWPSNNDPRFVGREAELDRIDSALATADWAVAVGERGAGRTRLLLELAFCAGVRKATFQCLSPRDARTLARIVAPGGPPDGIGLLVLDDVHRLGWRETERLLRRLGPRGPKVVMSASSDDPPPFRLRLGLGSRLATVRLPPLPDDAILTLAGLSPESSCAERTLSLARGKPLAAILAAEALDGRPGMAAVMDTYGLALTPDRAGFQKVERRAGEVQRALADELAGRSGLLCGEGAGPRLRRAVTAFYERQGYDAEVTVAATAGGTGPYAAADLYAAQRLEVGSFVTVVSCRRVGDEPTVEVGLMRRLHGAIDRNRPVARADATILYSAHHPDRIARWRRIHLSSQTFNTIHDMLKRISRR